MKTFTILLCLAAAVVTVMSSPTKSEDKELNEKWNQHKDSIMKRLEENDADLKRQYQEQLEKVKSSSGIEKESAQKKADALKLEIQKIRARHKQTQERMKSNLTKSLSPRKYCA
uniref:Uncharacterized protein n=1 Tax=Lygus hesperus TaxID=30085 RepID=A0A0K8S9G2_LYGHE